MWRWCASSLRPPLTCVYVEGGQLFEAFADVNTRDSLGSDLVALHRSPAAFAAAMEVGRTPLHWAAANGHVQVRP
ncbi:hypothetical protein T484DRAFT_1817454 [Baffinella frigidus]|nr:hypothetical protein T484DRAFT_1817454 [Cryptophyta sp. CCMP2293]